MYKENIVVDKKNSILLNLARLPFCFKKVRAGFIKGPRSAHLLPP